MKQIGNTVGIVFGILLLAVFVVPAGATTFELAENVGVQVRDTWSYVTAQGLDESAPIKISGDDDVYWSTVIGNGTIKNPYVIENLYINLNDTTSEEWNWHNGAAIWIEDVNSHFIIQNCTFWGKNYMYDDADSNDPQPWMWVGGIGIRLWTVTSAQVYNCTFILNTMGMEIYNTSDCVISDNYFNGYRHKVDEVTLLNLAAEGIHIHEMCSNFTIESNTFEFCGSGVIAFGLTNSSMIDNHASICSDALVLRGGGGYVAGHWEYMTNHCIVANNTIEWSYLGIGLGGGSYFLVENNTLRNNWNGVWLSEEVTNSTVQYNLLKDNGKIVTPTNVTITGVAIPASTNIEGYGIFASDGSIGNTITENVFIDNSVSGIDNVGNFYDYNYWSDYGGYDANEDGIGDTPYELAGESGSKDYHPRGPMQSGPTTTDDDLTTDGADIPMALVAVGGIFLAIAVIIVLSKRKKH